MINLYWTGPSPRILKWPGGGSREGGEHERGITPLSLGGLVFFFLILSASMCIFNGGFMRLGPDFSLLVTKIFLVA